MWNIPICSVTFRKCGGIRLRLRQRRSANLTVIAGNVILNWFRRWQVLDICAHCSPQKHMGISARWRIPGRSRFPSGTGCGIIRSMSPMSVPFLWSKRWSQNICSCFLPTNLISVRMRHSALANINRKNLPKSVASIGFILTMSKSLHNFWWKMEKSQCSGAISSGIRRNWWRNCRRAWSAWTGDTHRNRGKMRRGRSHRRVQCSICVRVYAAGTSGQT